MSKLSSIYLDHAAATPLDPRVFEVMQPWLTQNYFNPSSLYAGARAARAAIEAARWQVAQVLGAKKTEIIFTAGGTESINLALFGVAKAFPKSKIVATAIEHEAVLASLKALESNGHPTELVPVEADGIVRVEQINAAIDDETALVSIMYANNEIGTIQPIIKIAKLIAAVRDDRKQRGIKLPIFFHTDACQAVGFLDLHVSRLGVDLLTLNGSKIYGPKQSGCLYVRTGIKLEPLIYGGGQERGLRSGTENVAGIVGFAQALQLAASERIIEGQRLTLLRDDLLHELKSALPELVLNGHPTKRLPNNLNISLPGVDGETVILYLDKAGIEASTGSACSTGRVDPSHVLMAIGNSAAEARGSLRFTFGRGTTPADLKYLADTLPPLVVRLPIAQQA